MKTLYDLVTGEGFRKRPAMWLGQKSITILRTFIGGYETCEQFNEISPAPIPPFHLFLPWIQRLYNHDGSYFNWDGIILQNCDNDEAQALDKFLELFDKFRKLKRTIIDSKDITNDAAACFLPPKDADELFSARAIEEFSLTAVDESFIIEYDKESGCRIYHPDDVNTIWDSELLVKLRKQLWLIFRENQWVGTLPNQLN